MNRALVAMRDSLGDPTTVNDVFRERKRALVWFAAALVFGCSSSQETLGPTLPLSIGDGSTPMDESEAANRCLAAGSACTSNDACCGFSANQELCVDFGNGGMCVDVCKQNSDCATGCCAAASAEGALVCATSHCLAGIGDPCNADNECSSGRCSGFCTALCGENSACSGGNGTPGTLNASGQENWCAETSKDTDLCFPGCFLDADCSSFPGTTCQSAVDVGGNPRGICAG